MSKRGFLYIMTNQNNSVLYTGVTSDLRGRVYQHKTGLGGKFSGTYRTRKLVYYGVYEDIWEAISREKQIKAGSRMKKIDLIRGLNPDWRDLTDDL